jgi:hypothetical protein
VFGPNAATPLSLVAEGAEGRGDVGEVQGDSAQAAPDSHVGARAVVIDGQQKDSVVSVTPGRTVTLVGLTITNGLAGAAVGFNGGGISNTGGAVTVINSRIINNTANGQLDLNQGVGGGVYSTDTPSPAPAPPAAPPGTTTLTLVNTLVSGNKAVIGGGVSSTSFTATVHATLSNTPVENNSASAGGGGVLSCGTLTMFSSPIRNNTAMQGGGLTNCFNPPAGPSGTATLINSPVTQNKATGTTQIPGGPPPNPPGHGGGISNGGPLTLVNSPVSTNSTTGSGGGIFNLSPGTVTRINSPVRGNTGNPPAEAQCSAGLIC